MYAIIETGGKQYRVAPGETVEVELLDGQVGETISLSRVLMIQEETGPRIGTPILPKPPLLASNSVVSAAPAK